MGIIVKCNPLDPAHRESVLLLVTAELSDEMRYSEFKEHFADCDVLHDKEREPASWSFSMQGLLFVEPTTCGFAQSAGGTCRRSIF